MIKKIRTFIILLKNWRLLEQASVIVNDTKSLEGQLLSENLTMEEVEACVDLESIHRIFKIDLEALSFELKHLDKTINKKV